MPRFGLTLSTLVLLAGCGEEANIAGKELPQMEISTDRIDFGDASWGESVLKTITIRNTGALPLGVSNIALGIDEMEANFNLHLGTFVDCDGSSESNDDADEGEIIGGEEDTGMATDDVQEGEAAITFGSVIVINQGCTYDFQVSLNPTSVGAIFGSVIVETKTASRFGFDNYRAEDGPDTRWVEADLEVVGTALVDHNDGTEGDGRLALLDVIGSHSGVFFSTNDLSFVSIVIAFTAAIAVHKSTQMKVEVGLHLINAEGDV